MANSPKTLDPQASKKQDKSGSGFTILLVLILCFLLAGAGLAGAIYFKLIDLPALAADWKLYDYPVIGQLIPKPQIPADAAEAPPEDTSTNTEAAQPAIPVNPTPAGQPAAQPVDLAQQIKLQQQEEAKRLSKLARLYNTMKPEEAVPILNELDDNLVISIFNKMEEEQVSKILALMDPQKAAQLSQGMLRVKSSNP